MMNHRILIIGAAGIVCAAMLAAAFFQQRRVENLRTNRQELLDREAAPAAGQSSPSAEASLADTSVTTDSPAPSFEVLRLRNQVGQLTQRKRELLNVRAENEQLHAQLAARATNVQTALPPGYIRTSEARWAGTSTPENTIQSFLWALRNRDVTNFLQAVTPESGQKILQNPNFEAEFFGKNPVFPGMRIVSQEQIADDVIGLHVEVMPGESIPEPLRLRRMGSEWKIDLVDGF